MGHRGCRAVLQLLLIHRGDGSREVHLFLGSVAYHHDILHVHGVLREVYFQVVPRGGHGDFLADVTQIGEVERYVGVGNREREAAVGRGYRAAGVVSDECDGDACQRGFGRVVDCACDRAGFGRDFTGRDQDDLAFGDGEVEAGRGEHLPEGLRNRRSFGFEAHMPGKVGLLGVVEERVFAVLLDPGYGLRERNVRKLHVESRFLRLAIYNRAAGDQQQKDCKQSEMRHNGSFKFVVSLQGIGRMPLRGGRNQVGGYFIGIRF